MRFYIEKMGCSGCARSVTRAILTLDPDAIVKADPENRRLNVEAMATRTEIEAALAEAGFPARAEAS
ncbi:copper chaperone [Rhodobacteraceae bacterium 2CG4]|uniref:Copper chaperone n=1 Tax=Halovulum marinum TaxID=2662447 RepID=A0A6L5Z2N0_9RHOB|nr:heavy-metal-associated domain-containing protein [Halovulum marinum]MSU90330.1 copper chaperone [Halovulum marinum]